MREARKLCADHARGDALYQAAGDEGVHSNPALVGRKANGLDGENTQEDGSDK